ncbi:MAG TPA: hypothetical protein VIJ88_02980, partial [Candidatus Paceibacterota bacterium]
MDIENWFRERKEVLAINVEEIGLAHSRDWKVIEQDGLPHHIGHISGKYHRGIFLKAWDIPRGEWV